MTTSEPYEDAELDPDCDEDDGPPASSIGGDPTGLPRHVARVTAGDGRVQYVSDLTTVNTLRAMGGLTIETTCEVRVRCAGADASVEVSGTLACQACAAEGEESGPC